jgi:ATP-dependent protease ClpP protease subunit
MKNFITGIGSNNPIATISGQIGADFDAAYFSAQLRELAAKNIKPTININTPGGAIFPGMDILDVVYTEELNTHVAGLAASFGGMILMFGKKRSMNDFAMIMLHSVRGGNNKEALGKANEIFRSILENTTKLPKDILDDIFIKNKDKYFDSFDAEKYGLVDEVIATKVRIKDQVKAILKESETNNFSNSKENAKFIELFNQAVNSLYPNETAYAITRKNEYTNNMDNQFTEVKAKLGLDSSDTERDVLNSIKNLHTERDDLKAEVELKDGEIERLENKIASMNDQKAAELVNKAVEDGKIGEESKESFINFAKSDFEGAKKAINGINSNPVPNSVVDIPLTNTEKPTNELSDESILAKGYKALQSENPGLLNRLMSENKNLFNQLLDDHLNTL